MLRGETDETVLSRASTLGWHSTGGVVVVVGPAPHLEPAQALESIRHLAAIAGSDMLGAVQGDRMIVVLGGAELNAPDRTVEIVRKFVTMFGPGAVIVDPSGALDGRGYEYPRGGLCLPRCGWLAGGAPTRHVPRSAPRAGAIR